MLNGEKTYTPAGNVRAPSKPLCLEWVKRAWESVTTDVVKKSFQACGISVNVDGSEDHEIHCLKDGQVATAARDDIARETAALLAPQTENFEDPFADLEEDTEELENNVAIDDC